ncbi:MAG TPA: hypothetical protein DCX89_09695 [Saprospirales bacterium]|nr:hypothetical protein [Saprospirales bacterium]HRQ29657.1 XdhC family protein [Saprospiraceae bacterium]
MNIWSFIRSKLEADNRIILLVVIHSTGSSPGRAGFKMAVSEDGHLAGSIGGGVMEYKLVELARKQFSIEKRPAFLLKQDHEQTGTEDSSGMICSGNQYVAFYPVNESNLPLISMINESSKIQIEYTENGFSATENMEGLPAEPFVSMDLKQWKLVEQAGIENQLFIIGGGHVSVSVSQLFKKLDFQVIVLDDRNMELSTIQQNSYADQIRIIDYKDIADQIPEGPHVFVVIMTFGHRSDARVLELLIDKNVRYLGMMGSERKVQSIFEDLRSKGISEERLSTIDAPIGLPVNSETPMEIAISLAAKVIMVKNEK